MVALILCLYLVYGTTGISGSDATPTGADGIKYVTTGSSVNHTTNILFDFWTNETNTSFKSWRAIVTEISNLTFWTDITGTWTATSYNETAVTANTTYGFAYASYLAATEGEVQWNVKVGNISGYSEWLFSANKTYTYDFVEVRNIVLSPNGTGAENVFTSSTPTVNITVTGTESEFYCCLVMNNTQRGGCKYATNNTLTTFSGSESDWGLINGKSYSTYANCTKVGSGILTQTTAITYKFTDTAPTVVVVNPADDYWSNSQSVAVNITPTDLLIVNCSLYVNESGTGAMTLNQTIHKMTSGKSTNFSSLELVDSATGYSWGYVCTNEGNLATSENFTVYVDTLYPAKVSCVSPRNNTRSTDYRPTLTWVNGSADTGFDRYTIFFMNGSASKIFSYNISSEATHSFEITDSLTGDMQWYWNISVTDKAGNVNTSDNCTQPVWYYPDSVGHTLLAGYNFFGIVRNTDTDKVSASGLCHEPSVTPTSVSKWNFTSNGWATHVCGSSTRNFTMSKGDAVVFNMPSAGVWEANRVWDLDNSTTVLTNITNASGVNWNLIGILADTSMTDIDNGNRNITTLKPFDVANDTATTGVWAEEPYTLARRYIAYNSLLVYNGTLLISSGNYSINWNKGIFVLKGGQPVDANWSGQNLTFDYAINEIHMTNWMSYPNHSQVNLPFKTNWTLNGAATVFDGDALWVNLNDTMQTQLQLDRSLW